MQIIAFMNALLIQIRDWKDFPSARTLISQGRKATQARFNGVWLNVHSNPGKRVRNRYGIEIYKHVQSWEHLKQRSGFELLEAGMFMPCEPPGAQDCLDQFPADGSLQFGVPVP